MVVLASVRRLMYIDGASYGSALRQERDVQALRLGKIASDSLLSKTIAALVYRDSASFNIGLLAEARAFCLLAIYKHGPPGGGRQFYSLVATH